MERDKRFLRDDLATLGVRDVVLAVKDVVIGGLGRDSNTRVKLDAVISRDFEVGAAAGKATLGEKVAVGHLDRLLHEHLMIHTELFLGISSQNESRKGSKEELHDARSVD